MSLVSPTQVSDGTTADASDVNTPINQLAAVINGNIDNSNIVSGAAIDGAKLAANSIDIGAKASTWDGWIAVTDTWTYASSTTVTVPSDATAKYSVGDKVRFTNSGTKYFYITAVSSTVLTLNGGSDYSLANAAITLPFFSKEVSPTGFPDRFAFTPTWTSSGSAPSIGNGTFTGYFSMVGKKVYLRFKFVGGSTTTWGTGSYFINLPVAGYSGIAANDGFTLNGYAEDLSTVAYTVLGTRMENTSRFYVIIYAPQTTSVNNWAQTGPFTWSTGDYWSATGWYDAA